MCVFARTLPWPTVLRIWVNFFLSCFIKNETFSSQNILISLSLPIIRTCSFARVSEETAPFHFGPWSLIYLFQLGIKIVFRVALVILNSLEPDFKRAKCNSNDKLVETMEILKNLPRKYLEIDYLLPKVIQMDLSEKDLEAEHFSVLKQLKKKKKWIEVNNQISTNEVMPLGCTERESKWTVFTDWICREEQIKVTLKLPEKRGPAFWNSLRLWFWASKTCR